jgi:hypothetical protein
MMSIIGLLLIAGSILRLGKDMAFPGWLALAPTIGTALIISAGPGAALNRWILAQRPVVFVGLVSYPLYLWHWPLLVFQAGTLGYDTKTILMAKAAALLIAFGLSVATYRFLELPIRRWPLALVARRLPAFMIGVAAIALVPLLSHGLPKRVPEFAREKPDTLWHLKVREGDCDLTNASSVRSSICIESKRPLVFLWGDSHAAAFYPGLKSLQTRHNFGIGQMTQNACPPYLVNPPVAYRPDCAEVNREVLEQARRVQPDIFLLHASWKHSAYSMGIDQIMTHLKATTDTLRMVFPQARIVILGPVPQWKISLPRSMFLYWRTHGEVPPQYMRFMLLDGVRQIDRDLAVRTRDLGVEYVSLYDALCNDEGCRTADGPNGEHATSIDYGHLTASAASYAAAQIEARLFPEPEVRLSRAARPGR